jgi:hypothetical protein
MSARVILFFQAIVFRRKNSNCSFLIKAGTQKQCNRLCFFSFSKAGITRKPETGIRKRCKAWPYSDNRDRVTGEHREISIPDQKKDCWKSLSIAGKEYLSKFYTSPGDMFLDTGLDRSSQPKNFANSFAARNGFLIQSRGELTPELGPQLGRNPAGESIRVSFAWNLNRRFPATPAINTMIAVKERERISIRAQKKEIDTKNTGSVTRNNLLLQRRAWRSVPLRNVISKAYLAINWQLLKFGAQFTSRELRFATPAPQATTAENAREIDALLTTCHLLWPNETRKTAFLLPFSQPISHFPQLHFQRQHPPGAGSGARIRRKCFDRKAHMEIFHQ